MGIEERRGRHCEPSMWEVSEGGRLSEIVYFVLLAYSASFDEFVDVGS